MKELYSDEQKQAIKELAKRTVRANIESLQKDFERASVRLRGRKFAEVRIPLADGTVISSQFSLRSLTDKTWYNGFKGGYAERANEALVTALQEEAAIEVLTELIES